MLTAFQLLLVSLSDALAVVLTIPVSLFLLEIVAAFAPAHAKSPFMSRNGSRVAVLVPAHDESAGIGPTVANIAAQLAAGDRLLVVADNCTDDTACVAAAVGAEVIERHDPVRIGKGYALDHGLRHLADDPPDIVIMIDADCRLSANAVDTLTATCLATGRPVQALDLMTSPEHSSVDHRVAEFAWRVKNWARPLGLSRLGLPCQLMGTGMAFRWSTICAVDLASGQLVEDMRLGLDLASAGLAPVFCPDAVVTSEFPPSASGSATQRQRWEHGHIQTILTLAPRFLGHAIVHRNLGLATLALDVAIPPLAMLTLILGGTLLLGGVAALLVGWTWGSSVAIVDLVGLTTAVLLAWLHWGREVLPAAAVLSIAPYVIAKLGIYRDVLTRGAIAAWVRTARSR